MAHKIRVASVIRYAPCVSGRGVSPIIDDKAQIPTQYHIFTQRVPEGVSVTCTLPYGTPDDVRRELRWLVENGPPTGLFLGASSSITPGVPWQNVQALVEGLAHYRRHGRS